MVFRSSSVVVISFRSKLSWSTLGMLGVMNAGALDPKRILYDTEVEHG